MATELGYFEAVLKEAAGLGRPVEGLIPRVRELAEDADRLEVWASGKKIYRVIRRYERIVAEDEEAASHVADGLGGCFAEEQVELVEDPSETLRGTWGSSDPEPAEA